MKSLLLDLLLLMMLLILVFLMEFDFFSNFRYLVVMMSDFLVVKLFLFSLILVLNSFVNMLIEYY